MALFLSLDDVSVVHSRVALLCEQLKPAQGAARRDEDFVAFDLAGTPVTGSQLRTMYQLCKAKNSLVAAIAGSHGKGSHYGNTVAVQEDKVVITYAAEKIVLDTKHQRLTKAVAQKLLLFLANAKHQPTACAPSHP